MKTLARQLPVVRTLTSSECRMRKWSTCPTTLRDRNRRLMTTVHTRRELHYPIEGGVGDFLPPNALQTIVKWQDGLLERLNGQVRGTSLAKSNILQIIIDSAGDKKSIMAFNYACLAANNSFFLDNLKPPGESPNEKEVSPELMSGITREFIDLDTLKERFVASASGMVSSGWLWLVTDGQQRLAVVPTFGASTLLVRSRNYWSEVQQGTLARQPMDWLSEPLERAPSPPGVFPPLQDGLSPSSPISGVRASPSQLSPNTPARSLHSSAPGSTNPSVRDAETLYTADSGGQRKALHQIGSKLYPLCCLSLFEHTWMSAGLGVWGKEEYVRRFFTVLNWKKVSETFGKFNAAKHRGSTQL